MFRRHRHRAFAGAVICAASLALGACGDQGEAPSNQELLTTDGFAEALGAVGDKVGEEAQVLSIQITGRGGEFNLIADQRPRLLTYTAGELAEGELQVIGEGVLEGQDFPLSEIDPEAIDRMVEGINSQTGGRAQVTVIALEGGSVGDERRWRIAAQGAGVPALAYTADPDGANLTPTREAAREQGL